MNRLILYIYNILYSANIPPHGVTYSPKGSANARVYILAPPDPASFGVVVPVYLDKALNLNTAPGSWINSVFPPSGGEDGTGRPLPPERAVARARVRARACAEHSPPLRS